MYLAGQHQKPMIMLLVAGLLVVPWVGVPVAEAGKRLSSDNATVQKKLGLREVQTRRFIPGRVVRVHPQSGLQKSTRTR